jgi:pyrimidine operon attenuation protein/uracil phosphoribosyltransferase
VQTSYDQADLTRLIDRLAADIAQAFSKEKPLNIVGIRTRGETLADRLTAKIAHLGFSQIGRGVLDITLYRDDLSEIGPKPMVRPTRLDIEIDGRPMMLVDDVLFTGRTVRAALNELADFGRPSLIRLAVLVDRGGRELPIQADFVALKLEPLPRDHRVKVQLSEDDGRDGILVERIPGLSPSPGIPGEGRGEGSLQ